MILFYFGWFWLPGSGSDHFIPIWFRIINVKNKSKKKKVKVKKKYIERKYWTMFSSVSSWAVWNNSAIKNCPYFISVTIDLLLPSENKFLKLRTFLSQEFLVILLLLILFFYSFQFLDTPEIWANFKMKKEKKEKTSFFYTVGNILYF